MAEEFEQARKAVYKNPQPSAVVDYLDKVCDTIEWRLFSVVDSYFDESSVIILIVDSKRISPKSERGLRVGFLVAQQARILFESVRSYVIIISIDSDDIISKISMLNSNLNSNRDCVLCIDCTAVWNVKEDVAIACMLLGKEEEALRLIKEIVGKFKSSRRASRLQVR